MKELLKRLQESKQIYIYGIGMVGITVYYALKHEMQDRLVGFTVTKLEGQELKIDKYNIQEIKCIKQENALFLIATPQDSHNAIIQTLEKLNLTNYYCIDSKVENKILEKYYKNKTNLKLLCNYKMEKKKSDITIYMSRYIGDRVINTQIEYPKWMKQIQAGASLTTKRISDICDNVGENISDKNPIYSELTSLYWAYKHGSSDYIGLCHYRRIFEVSEEDLYRIQQKKIDFILTYPSIQYPNILAHHLRYITNGDWELMKEAISYISPGYMKHFDDIFLTKYFYHFNMVIGKRDLFCEFCEWLFSVLFKIEELKKIQGSEITPRYIGYLAENLTTFYFLLHKSKYKIAHVGRTLLI